MNFDATLNQVGPNNVTGIDMNGFGKEYPKRKKKVAKEMCGCCGQHKFIEKKKGSGGRVKVASLCRNCVEMMCPCGSGKCMRCCEH